MSRKRCPIYLCPIGFLFALFTMCTIASDSRAIPLPEHPRPDFERSEWINLNGSWKFQFDLDDEGLSEKWFQNSSGFNKTIMVPFPWGSQLSQVESEADLAWYAREISVPESWKGKRIFLVVGACDWKTTAWLDGQELGNHQGGYTPFEFELTPYIHYGSEQKLVLRVDDSDHHFKLNGKQGYGQAKGIWQTPYLETRGQNPLSTLHFQPDIDQEKVIVKASLLEPAPMDVSLALCFKTGDVASVNQTIPKGTQSIQFEIPIPNAHLWTLDDPFLYEVEASTGGENRVTDTVNTYFGMRKISVTPLPGTDIPYVALNNKPIYLQLTLDQAYHPEGFYTFPSDNFVRDEILRSKQIGLNGMRVHVKVPIPRKLYWADRLGMLIMADVPNSWGEPDSEMRNEIEFALRGMIHRDFNHPSIFSWITFNETWGLKTKGQREQSTYTPETQKWVTEIYHLAKSLDPSRLVEDNSACLYDHTETDLNSWHAYLPGYEWTKFLDEAVKSTFPGSQWNFAAGYRQGNQPMLNSECGNVWGYDGSTGDVDWSWDYHRMMNAFRRQPKICGWLYTEHHDVINEWNGYYRFDRSEKYTGLDDLARGMSLNDLHGSYYISLGEELCLQVHPGQTISVPVFASFFTEKAPADSLQLRWEFVGWDTLGQSQKYSHSSRKIPFSPWMQQELDPIKITMPSSPCLAILCVSLCDPLGTVLHRNFSTFMVSNAYSPRQETIKENDQTLRVVRFSPSSFQSSTWSQKQWNVLYGLKVNGAGSGYFEYRIPWPKNLNLDDVEEVVFLVEVSAKQLFGKDQEGAQKQEGDFMLGKGTHDPSLNPNSYPMTDEIRYPSRVRIRVEGENVGTFDLPDDPADHRGILSWYSQIRDKKLREAGSYGYLLSVPISKEILQSSAKQNEIVLRMEVDPSLPHGLAIYGERFGRYPLDPTLIFKLHE